MEYNGDTNEQESSYFGIMMCPHCKSESHFNLVHQNSKHYLICESCKANFEINDSTNNEFLNETVDMPSKLEFARVWDEIYTKTSSIISQGGKLTNEVLALIKESIENKFSAEISRSRIDYVINRYLYDYTVMNKISSCTRQEKDRPEETINSTLTTSSQVQSEKSEDENKLYSNPIVESAFEHSQFKKIMSFGKVQIAALIGIISVIFICISNFHYFFKSVTWNTSFTSIFSSICYLLFGIALLAFFIVLYLKIGKSDFSKVYKPLLIAAEILGIIITILDIISAVSYITHYIGFYMNTDGLPQMILYFIYQTLSCFMDIAIDLLIISSFFYIRNNKYSKYIVLSSILSAIFIIPKGVVYIISVFMATNFNIFSYFYIISDIGLLLTFIFLANSFEIKKISEVSYNK